MEPEQLERESEVIIDDNEISQSDVERLSSMMDNSGDLPPHGEADEEAEESAAEEATEARQPANAVPQGETVEVEHDGEKFAVPAKLKDAFLRQADYTRKTQEVATERAAAQQERQIAAALMQESQQLVGHYAAIQQSESQLQQVVKMLQDDPQMGVTDPLRNLELRTAYQELLRSRDAAIGNLNQARQAIQFVNAATTQQQMAQAIEQGTQVLQRDIPNWGADTQKALLDEAMSHGFTQQELSGLTDPRQVKILHKAWLWDQMQAKKPAVEKQIRQAPPKAVRSSSNVDRTDAPPRNDALAKLRRSHNDGDAVAALRALGIE